MRPGINSSDPGGLARQARLRRASGVAALLLLAAAATTPAQFTHPSYAATQSFQDDPALAQIRMGMTFDGTGYWSCSGGSPVGNRLAYYDAAGVFQQRYAAGLDPRSVFTYRDAPPVFLRAVPGGTIHVQTAPGVFAPHVTLTGGPVNAQSAVVFNDAGEFISLGNGTVSRWDASGVFAGSLALNGYGGRIGESAYPQNRGVAFLGGHYLTYSNGTLSAWDPNGNRVGTTQLLGAGTGFESHFSFSSAHGMVWVLDAAGGTWRGYDVGLGMGCSMLSPASPATGNVPIQVHAYSRSSPTMDLSWEFSVDSGATYTPCTAAGSSPCPNPAPGEPVGVVDFLWDSLADQVGQAAVASGVLIRVTVEDRVAPAPGQCTSPPFDVNNFLPAPTCTLSVPPGVQRLDVVLRVDTASANSPTVSVTFEYSKDGGLVFSPCTASGLSVLPNPAPGIPTGSSTFTWASRTDGVGLRERVPGLCVRARVDDGVSPVIATCATSQFDLDNTSICGHVCGDCDLDSTGPNIIDWFVASQLAVGIRTPTAEQTGCCDVDSSGVIDVIDALLMAQASIQIPVPLICQ